MPILIVIKMELNVWMIVQKRIYMLIYKQKNVIMIAKKMTTKKKVIIKINAYPKQIKLKIIFWMAIIIS